MKILFTTHFGELAGSSFSLIYLAKGLTERGHDIHVACKKGCLVWNELQSLSQIKLHDIGLKSYFDWRSARDISRLVKNESIDLINPQGGRDRNLIIFAKWRYRLLSKIVFTRRQRPRDEPWIKRYFHIKFTDKIVVVSHGLKAIFLKKGYHSAHLHVIHNGVPDDIIFPLSETEKNIRKQQLGLSGLIIGCLSRKKIQEEIILALRYIKSDVSVLFIGINREDFDAKILKTAEGHHIFFAGKINHVEALEYLQILDVNILASHMDGFGLVLVESMLAGVPVIGSDFGGIPDVIDDGQNGYLFQNGNPEELASKIDQLLTSEVIRQKFVKNGLKTSRIKFNINQTIDQYEQLFYELI